MFEGISFLHTEAKTPITSRQISDETYNSGKYDPENLRNSEFYITGCVDGFRQPPITPFAKENLYHLQAFSIFRYGKGSYTRRQDFRSYLILYTYEGAGEVEYEGKKYTLNAEDGILIDCRKPHFYQAITDWKVAVLHFQGPLAEYMVSQYEAMGRLKFHESVSGRFHRYIEQLLSIYDSPGLHRDLRANHCFDSILLYLLILSSDEASISREAPQSVKEAMHHMEQHFEESICLDDLADLTRTNKFHLAKEFKRYTGFAPHDYLIWLRINQAKLLLTSTTLPANKIAHMVGIHDINNFNYLFKKKVGMTPIQYRNSTDYLL